MDTNAPDRGPWGAGATLGWTLVVALVFTIVQLVVLAVAIGIEAGVRMTDTSDSGAIVALAEDVAGDGVFLGAAATASAVFGIALILVIVKLRRGPAIGDYLAMRPVRLMPLLFWLAVAVATGLLFDLIWPLIGREKVPEFMLTAARTGRGNVFFWLGLVVAAPLFEELMCRGFMLTGWMRSALKPWCAVLLISLLWAGAHLQYGWQEMVAIAVIGVVFGVARLRTGSLWTPVAMHVLQNLIATIQASTTVH